MIYGYQKHENSPFKLVLGEFENLLEALEPHALWDDEKTDGQNFLDMVKEYRTFEVLTRYSVANDWDEWKDCKQEFLSYVKEIYE